MCTVENGTTERLLIDANMPGVTTRQEAVAIELFGEKRPFLIVTNTKYKESKMDINARDFGANLDVSWYFTAESRFLKRTMSKYATGDPKELSMHVNIFAQQDISAFKCYYSVFKFFQVDITGLVRMPSCARYFKEGVGSSRPNWRWIMCFLERPKANTSCNACVKLWSFS